MARALSKVAQKYKRNHDITIKHRARDYTKEPGPHGRGEPTHLYDCLTCEKGDHQTCENSQMIMCRCWRTMHKDPPPPRGRQPVKRNAPGYTPPVQADDDIDWE